MQRRSSGANVVSSDGTKAASFVRREEYNDTVAYQKKDREAEMLERRAFKHRDHMYTHKITPTPILTHVAQRFLALKRLNSKHNTHDYTGPTYRHVTSVFTTKHCQHTQTRSKTKRGTGGGSGGRYEFERAKANRSNRADAWIQ